MNKRTAPVVVAPSLALLAAVTATGFCALHIVVPALPLLTKVFGDSPARVQLVLTLYLGGIAVGQLFYGPISDRFGRRPVLIAGLTLFLAGTLLCGFAWSLTILIVGRVLEALGACAGIVLGRAIIRDVYEREAAARGIALVMMAMTLAPAMAPSFGAYLAVWVDWRAIFGLLGLLGAIVLALTIAGLRETNLNPTRLDLSGMAGSYLTLLRTPVFVGFALCSACASASWFTFCASAPHVLVETLGEPASTYGLMILLPMGAYMIGNAAAARFAVRLGTRRLLIAGRLLSFAAAVAMASWYVAVGLDIWALFLPIALSSIGDGMSQPSALAAGLSVHPRLAGTASGLIGFLQMTVAAMGTFVVALLPYEIAANLVAVVAGFIALALVFGLFALRRPSGGALAGVPGLRLSREESV
ncbi:MAG TPA: multidrug effflux MFS transporter [Stellaceae bacterium]|jgi:DHA1 family bicyclomycin/chloramphenicol resistance-like MFS transporter|nr:multidrug effflux MFS transporter [Stellaceae bacterium]